MRTCAQIYAAAFAAAVAAAAREPDPPDVHACINCGAKRHVEEYRTSVGSCWFCFACLGWLKGVKRSEAVSNIHVSTGYRKLTAAEAPPVLKVLRIARQRLVNPKSDYTGKPTRILWWPQLFENIGGRYEAEASVEFGHQCRLAGYATPADAEAAVGVQGLVVFLDAAIAELESTIAAAGSAEGGAS